MGISQAAGAPVSSPIGALKYTAISPCIDDAGILRVNGQGINIEVSQAARSWDSSYCPIRALIYTAAIVPA